MDRQAAWGPPHAARSQGNSGAAASWASRPLQLAPAAAQGPAWRDRVRSMAAGALWRAVAGTLYGGSAGWSTGRPNVRCPAELPGANCGTGSDRRRSCELLLLRVLPRWQQVAAHSSAAAPSSPNSLQQRCPARPASRQLTCTPSRHCPLGTSSLQRPCRLQAARAQMKLPPGHVAGQGVAKPRCTGGFGERMLRSMGWAEGEGLGRESQGIKAAIEVKKKEDTVGVSRESCGSCSRRALACAAAWPFCSTPPASCSPNTYSTGGRQRQLRLGRQVVGEGV